LPFTASIPPLSASAHRTLLARAGSALWKVIPEVEVLELFE
jgi:hypothetical protein